MLFKDNFDFQSVQPTFVKQFAIEPIAISLRTTLVSLRKQNCTPRRMQKLSNIHKNHIFFFPKTVKVDFKKLFAVFWVVYVIFVANLTLFMAKVLTFLQIP